MINDTIFRLIQGVVFSQNDLVKNTCPQRKTQNFVQIFQQDFAMIFIFEGSRAENAGFIMFITYINKVALFGFSNLFSEVSS